MLTIWYISRYGLYDTIISWYTFWYDDDDDDEGEEEEEERYHNQIETKQKTYRYMNMSVYEYIGKSF